MARVTIVGLGPAGPDLLTRATLDAIAAIPTRFVRTERHPSAGAVAGAASFDHHYEQASTLPEVYQRIVEDLVAAAGAHGEVLYAVPGSPAVAERTVELLLADPRVDTVVVPALSCIDLAWVRLAVDPLAAGARIIDGHRFESEASGERGPLLILQCDRSEILVAVKLAAGRQSRQPVTLLHHLGLDDERVEQVEWQDLDRVQPDHLTMIWVPEAAPAAARELAAFADLVRTLREQCPWDRVQTHTSLRRYLLEETYEVLDAIDSGDGEHLEEELGDLLFQVVFHATLAEEDGEFTLADVAAGIHEKLVRRHPHVFAGSDEPPDWEAIKRDEKGRQSVMEGIPDALPSLLYALKVQRKAAGVGFDWADVDGAWPKVVEEMAEVKAAAPSEVEGEMGDLLFACVNVARHLGVDPESALRGATLKFRRRFAGVERLAASRGIDLDAAGLAELDGLWDEVKAGGEPAP
jgi:tetrapyrrole methylase family protein / MazG family protein